MYPLFETLCIENRKIQNIDLHQVRYERSLREYYGKSAVKIFNLFFTHSTSCALTKSISSLPH